MANDVENEVLLNADDSLRLIADMLARAKSSYFGSGFGLIFWGCTIAICSLTTYAEVKGWFKLSFDIWYLTVVGAAAQLFFSIRYKKQRKVVYYDEKVLNYVWGIYAIAIFLLTYINNTAYHELRPIKEAFVTAYGTDKPFFKYSDLQTAFYLLLYGIPTIITGGIRNYKLLLAGGIFCWVACIISLYTKLDGDMLLSAASAIFAWLIPGIVLQRKIAKQAS